MYNLLIYIFILEDITATLLADTKDTSTTSTDITNTMIQNKEGNGGAFNQVYLPSSDKDKVKTVVKARNDNTLGETNPCNSNDMGILFSKEVKEEDITELISSTSPSQSQQKRTKWKHTKNVFATFFSW